MASPGTKLRKLLAGDPIVLGGGAHDALSARIVQRVGYPMCVVTGGGVSMCRGHPDVGLVTMEEMVANARYIAEAIDIPVIVDADNGYGNAINVRRTVREFERAGVAGVHIEDQVWPKRCGHMFGKRVIPKEEMVQKIHAALDARRDKDFVIIARCDALIPEGIEKTLERGEAYLEAGADMLFFEMRESMDEIKAMANQFRARIPLHFNHSPSGMVPRLHVREVEALGFKTVCFYAHALMAAVKTMEEVLTEIKETGNSLSTWDRMVSFDEYWRIGGLDEIRALEKKYRHERVSSRFRGGRTPMMERYVLPLLMLCGFACDHALAQGYPSKAIRFIIPSTPGGGNDTLAREIGQRISESLGQPVIADNRPGASMTIAAALAAKSPPDGHTIFMVNNSVLAINPSLFRNLPYDPVRDFAPIALLAAAPFVLLVHPSVPAKNVRDLIALARKRPGQLNFASSGTGISNHLAGEMLKTMAKIDIVHVPYKGGGLALTETIAGQVEMFFTNVLSALPHVKSGRLRALAVTGAKRSPVLPEMPTIQEAGGELAGYEVSTWYGVVAPAATPADVIVKLNAEIVRVLGNPKVRDRFAAEGADIIGSTPAEFARVIRDDIERWARVIKQTGLKIDAATQ